MLHYHCLPTGCTFEKLPTDLLDPMAATGAKALGAVEFLRICGRLKVRGRDAQSLVDA